MRDLPASIDGPPIALQKWGEVRLQALCVSSVAATKSAKDKGFSRVFMWAKVGRKELCQRWRSFGFLVGGGILGWAIEMRAVWRAELRGGAWDLSFCGEKGDDRAALSMGRGVAFLGWRRG